MDGTNNRNAVTLVCFVVISFTVAGYFTGLQSPMSTFGVSLPTLEVPEQPRTLEANVIPATHYADMAKATRNRTTAIQTSLKDLKSNMQPLAEVKISEQDKADALLKRDKNRAFNGAPPTIPHTVDQTSAQACMACHGEGIKTKTLRIPKMSHQFLANCTQCHVESNPRHMLASLFKESRFVGLPAPTAGPRAFPGAPPQMPHSTWIRSDCMSCHGFAGSHGIRTTHPWRKNCQQCHTPSSQLDQTLIAAEPKFLAPPNVD